MKYELVAGFETHIELATKTKIFCGCTTQFGGEPNSHCCPVCIGLPGTLPKLNRQVVRYGIMAGLKANMTVVAYLEHILYDKKEYIEKIKSLGNVHFCNNMIELKEFLLNYKNRK